MKPLAFMLIAWTWFDYTEFEPCFLVKDRIYLFIYLFIFFEKATISGIKPGVPTLIAS